MLSKTTHVVRDRCIRQNARCLTVLAIAMGILTAVPLHAHNLDQRFAYINLDPETLDTMRARAAAGEEPIQTGDILGVILESTPGPGTLTGVGGYLTFYLPTSDPLHPRVRYVDGQESLNDSCIVLTGNKLNRRVPPAFVNGRPLGFC